MLVQATLSMFSRLVDGAEIHVSGLAVPLMVLVILTALIIAASGRMRHV